MALTKHTLTLPSISDLTGVNATEPRTSASRQSATITVTSGHNVANVPNSVVNDSAASRNSVVATALSFSLSTGTSVKDFLSVSRKVPPSGYDCAAAIVFCDTNWVFWVGRTSGVDRTVRASGSGMRRCGAAAASGRGPETRHVIVLRF